jgi:hypothetical protein
MAKITLEELCDIAFAHEQGDPIDWGIFAKGQSEAMKMIGSSVLEMFDRDEITDDLKLIMLATITKLTTENMILHSKLLTQSQKDS